MNEDISLYGIWCKLCALRNVLLMLCAGLSSLATNLVTISNNNVLIKDKVTMLVGDPDAPCPDCPEPTDELVAQQQVTQSLVEQTESLQVQSALIKEQATAVRSKFTVAKKSETVEKTEPATVVRG